jgi:ABC-type dipeptide/oligopeptide/nickel transport system permease component
MSLAVVGGVTAGVLAGVARSKWADGLAMSTALVGLSVPNYWLAILGIILFGVNLGWISVTGGEGLKDLILPSLCLALGPGAVIARLTRSSMLEVKREDYVFTARAKGLSELRITMAHVLRTALIPVVTVVGLQFAGMLSGAVFIEAVFARPGIGRLAVNAIATRDYPQVQGVVLFLAIAYALANLAVDILYAALDPRIRYR